MSSRDETNEEAKVAAGADDRGGPEDRKMCGTGPQTAPAFKKKVFETI